MNIVDIVSNIMTALTVCMYGYLILYIIIALFDIGRKRVIKNKQYKTILEGGVDSDTFTEEEPEFHKFAFLIPARNEEKVIGSLIDSINQIDYPKDMYEVFVVADNCSDNTASIARQAGANVLERFDENRQAKSYALDFAFQYIKNNYGSYKAFDGYFIFDADNVVSKGYAKAMNREFSKGFQAVQGYRNSKNFGDNWITAGYSISFIREAKYLNNPRTLIKSSAMIGGPGYLVSSSIIEENDGWHYNLITEDIELSADLLCKGRQIGYAEDAMFYDEQPVSFMQSMMQRLRWTKGFFQVMFKYGGILFINIFKNLFTHPLRAFANFDILMTLAPSTVLTLATAACTVIGLMFNIQDFDAAVALIPYTITSILTFGLAFYGITFVFGLVAVMSEWDKIVSKNYKKILYLFSFPIFMVTYIPLCFIALFTGNKWRQIKHTKVRSLRELEGEAA